MSLFYTDFKSGNFRYGALRAQKQFVHHEKGYAFQLSFDILIVEIWTEITKIFLIEFTRVNCLSTMTHYLNSQTSLGSRHNLVAFSLHAELQISILKALVNAHSPKIVNESYGASFSDCQGYALY